MENNPPIDFNKQDVGRSVFTPLNWEAVASFNTKFIPPNEDTYTKHATRPIPNKKCIPPKEDTYTKHATQPIPNKKLRPLEPILHVSHGNCYGRGYTSFLRRSMVPSRSNNSK